MSEQDFYLGFSVFPGVGAGRFQLLLDHFDSAEAAWNASESELRIVLKEKLTADFIVFRKTFYCNLYKEKLKKAGVSVITLADETYPIQLKDLSNPPFVLYIKGNNEILNQVQDDKIESPTLRANEVSREDGGFISEKSSRLRSNNKMIGVVGTRKVTQYGRQITETFTRELVDEGFVVISGLALGVDATAHQETINSGGKTIAVLGCGVDCCYPSTNYGLYKNIIETGGLVISEYPLSAPPNKGSFPSRNRIIAALSQGLLVTEGAEDSGSLITAGIALDLGRTVFAVPGPVTSSLSRGPLKLIRKGAKLVTSGEEILEELGLVHEKKSENKIIGDTKDEQKIIDSLENEELSFDEIVKKTDIPAHSLGALLSLMEMKGSITNLSSGKFQLNTTS